MPYLIASLIAIVSATVVLLSRYEADDSLIKSEINRMETMFTLVDGYVNIYIQAGGNLSEINFTELNDSGILPANVTVTDDGLESKMTFIKSNVTWQMISKDSSLYKLLVDFNGNSALMSKAVFSESFLGREFCEKLLFGDYEQKSNSYNDTEEDFEDDGSGSNDDGIFECIVYK